MSTIKIPLHSRKHPGLFAVIDPADLPSVASNVWTPRRSARTFYAQKSSASERPIGMHRFLLPDRSGVHIDHINGNGLDNRRQNLRYASIAEGAKNKGLGVDNTSGYKGVSYIRTRNRWHARIGRDGKNVSLGMHATAEDAARAYDVAAREMYGEFARLNFPLPHEVPARRDAVVPRIHDGPCVVWVKPGSHIQNKAVPVALMEEAERYPFVVWRDERDAFHASSPDLEHALMAHIIVDAECREEATAMILMAIAHLIALCRHEGQPVPEPHYTPGLIGYTHPDTQEAIRVVRQLRPATSLIWQV